MICYFRLYHKISNSDIILRYHVLIACFSCFDLMFWYHTLISYYEIIFWYYHKISYYDIILWYLTMISYYDTMLWYHDMISYFHITLSYMQACALSLGWVILKSRMMILPLSPNLEKSRKTQDLGGATFCK